MNRPQCNGQCDYPQSQINWQEQIPNWHMSITAVIQV